MSLTSKPIWVVLRLSRSSTTRSAVPHGYPCWKRHVRRTLEEDAVVHQRQHRSADHRNPSDPTESEYENRQRSADRRLRQGSGHLAQPTAASGDVVHHPLAIARVEATTKRVPEPAHWARPAWGIHLYHASIIGFGAVMSPPAQYLPPVPDAGTATTVDPSDYCNRPTPPFDALSSTSRSLAERRPLL